MGTNRRSKPEHLAAKLLAIRERLHLSQSRLGRLVGLTNFARVSEYEHGTREPNLLVLLRYARVAGVSTDVLIDDKLELPELETRKASGTTNMAAPNDYERPLLSEEIEL